MTMFEQSAKHKRQCTEGKYVAQALYLGKEDGILCPGSAPWIGVSKRFETAGPCKRTGWERALTQASPSSLTASLLPRSVTRRKQALQYWPNSKLVCLALEHAKQRSTIWLDLRRMTLLCLSTNCQHRRKQAAQTALPCSRTQRAHTLVRSQGPYVVIGSPECRTLRQ